MRKLLFVGIFLSHFYLFSQSNNNPRISPVHAGAFSNNRLTYVVGKIYVLSPPPSGKQSEIKETASNNIKIYPNPVTNFLTIETLDKSLIKYISISDMSGKLMYSNELENNTLDLSFLKQGTYTVKLDNDNSKTFKIIKN